MQRVLIAAGTPVKIGKHVACAGGAIGLGIRFDRLIEVPLGFLPVVERRSNAAPVERGSAVVLDRIAKLKPAVLVVELLQRWLTASC